MRFGLSENNIALITRVLQKYPVIESVVIFGSRAIGNFATGSDIDIALKGNINLDMLAKIKAELEELSLPYFFDLVVYNSISNPDLKEHIDHYGISFMSPSKINSSIKITIRPATLEDMEEIRLCGKFLLQYEQKFDSTIDVDWLEEKGGEEFLIERIKQEGGIVLVAVCENKIVGYLAGGFIEPEPYRNLHEKSLVDLEEIFLSEECRGQNVGGALLDAFSTWAKEHGASRMKVIVSAHNKSAIGFYKKMFFKDYDLILEKTLF